MFLGPIYQYPLKRITTNLKPFAIPILSPSGKVNDMQLTSDNDFKYKYLFRLNGKYSQVRVLIIRIIILK